jgi:hypothetical protein
MSHVCPPVIVVVEHSHIDGFASEACGGDVSLTAMLAPSSGSTGHKWHVHDDAMSDMNACATASGHYDPTGVDIDGYICNPAATSACYTGDLAGKFGAVVADGGL